MSWHSQADSGGSIPVTRSNPMAQVKDTPVWPGQLRGDASIANL